MGFYQQLSSAFLSLFCWEYLSLILLGTFIGVMVGALKG